MTVHVFLPLQQDVSIIVLTNAAGRQRAKVKLLTAGNHQTFDFDGSGEGNKEIGRTSFKTGNLANDIRGFEVEVFIEADNGAGGFAESAYRIFPGTGRRGDTYVSVGGEDRHTGDESKDDFDDCLVKFLNLVN